MSNEARLAVKPVRQVEECGDRSGQATDWVSSTLGHIPAWQEASRLVLLRWTLADHALAMGERHCRDTVSNIEIEGIRLEESGFNRTVIASLNPSQAAAEQSRAAEMLARLAMCELIGLIEETLIKAYRLLLFENPCLLTHSWENGGIKRLFSRRAEKPEAWQKSWSRQVDRALDELRSRKKRALVLCYWRDAGLAMPKRGLSATVEDLDAAIGFFLAIRENILKRPDSVGSGLARLSDLMGFKDFRYAEGSPLAVDARQIELVEAFFHEYLEILRRALEERGPD